MNNPTFKILAAATLIAAGTGAAMAQGPGGGGLRMDFAQLDADGSGEITAEDLAMLKDETFGTLDSDSSGDVSEAEFIAQAEARAAVRAKAMFARLDADGDGVLSRDVLESRGGRGGPSERMISRFDTDESGGISAEEFEAAMEKMADRRNQRGKGRGDRGWGFSRN